MLQRMCNSRVSLNIYTAISIFKDCEVKINGNDIEITESKGTGYIALTITPDIKPYLISIKGAFEEDKYCA
jgi:hypothetical protein